jgi:hypothetical protein
MVKIDDDGPFRVFFYSNEHEPAHVHVGRDDGEVRIILFGENGLPELDWSVGLKKSDVRQAYKLVVKKQAVYHQAWIKHFGKVSKKTS